MICRICGNYISDDAKFCTSCGAEIEKIEKEDISVPFGGENSDGNAPDSAAENDENNFVPAAEENPVEETASPVSLEKPAEDVQEPAFGADSNLGEQEASAPAEEENNSVPFIETPQASEVFVHEERMTVEAAPKKLTAGRAVGASAVSLFAVIFLIVFNLIFTARIGLGGDIIGKAASSVKAETLLDSELDDGKSCAEYIFDKLDDKLVERGNSKVKDLRTFLIEADFVEFISESAEGYASYLISGTGDDPTVDSGDIAGFIEDNGTLFYYEMGYNMTENDYEDLEKSLSDEGIDEMLSLDSWGDSIGFGMKNVHFIFSFITIGVIFALVLVLYIWTAIILDRHTKHIMGFFRTITLIGGLVVFIPTALFLIGAPFVIADGGSTVVYLAWKLLTPFMAIGACTGLFEIIVAVIFGKISKLIKKRERKMNGGC